MASKVTKAKAATKAGYVPITAYVGLKAPKKKQPTKASYTPITSNIGVAKSAPAAASTTSAASVAAAVLGPSIPLAALAPTSVANLQTTTTPETSNGEPTTMDTKKILLWGGLAVAAWYFLLRKKS